MTESAPLDPPTTDQPAQLPAIIPPGVVTSPIDAYAATLVPPLIADAGNAAGWRYVEFFTANIRNPHTRRAYARSPRRCTPTSQPRASPRTRRVFCSAPAAGTAEPHSPISP
jgi:hypothetical protein